jgi:hypothetical protein
VLGGGEPGGATGGRHAARGRGVQGPGRLLEAALSGGRVDHGDHLALADLVTGVEAQLGQGALGGRGDRGGGAGGDRAGGLDDLGDSAHRGGTDGEAGRLVAAGGRGQGWQQYERDQQDAGAAVGAGHDRHSMPGHRPKNRADRTADRYRSERFDTRDVSVIRPMADLWATAQVSAERQAQRQAWSTGRPEGTIGRRIEPGAVRQP